MPACRVLQHRLRHPVTVGDRGHAGQVVTEHRPVERRALVADAVAQQLHRARAQAGRGVAGEPGNLQVAHHDPDRGRGHQRPVGHQVVVLQVVQRRRDDAAGVRITRAVPVAGEVLEHRQQPGVPQPLRVGPGVVGDLRRIGAERTVADHGVVGRVGDVDDGREVDGNAQFVHLAAAVGGQVMYLAGSSSGPAPWPTAPSRSASQSRRPGRPLRRRRPPAAARRWRSGPGRSGPEDGQVGPAADEDAADVVSRDDGFGVVGVLHAHHQQLGEFVAEIRYGCRVSAHTGPGPAGVALGRRLGRWAGTPGFGTAWLHPATSTVAAAIARPACAEEPSGHAVMRLLGPRLATSAAVDLAFC